MHVLLPTRQSFYNKINIFIDAILKYFPPRFLDGLLDKRKGKIDFKSFTKTDKLA